MSADGIFKHCLAFLILAWNPQKLDQAGHCVRKGRGGMFKHEVMPEEKCVNQLLWREAGMLERGCTCGRWP